MAGNPSIDRRTALQAGLAILGSLVLPGCSDSTAHKPTTTPEGNTVPDRMRSLVRDLPPIDPSIGSKVSETLVPGAEKLLVVIRYGHLNARALEASGPTARELLLQSQPQVVNLIQILAKHLEVRSLTGDGLLPENAAELNGGLQYLRTTRQQLGDVVNFPNAATALESCKQGLADLPSGHPERANLLRLQAVIESKHDLVDRVLRTYTETQSILAEHASIEPIVHVALERGLDLYSTEDPELHSQTLAEAIGEHDIKKLSRLNELREDAILNSIANSDAGEKVFILCMGAMHRFEDNALRRSTLPPRERVSVVEYNPRALPDDFDELLQAMSR